MLNPSFWFPTRQSVTFYFSQGRTNSIHQVSKSKLKKHSTLGLFHVPGTSSALFLSVFLALSFQNTQTHTVTSPHSHFTDQSVLNRSSCLTRANPVKPILSVSKGSSTATLKRLSVIGGICEALFIRFRYSFLTQMCIYTVYISLHS